VELLLNILLLASVGIGPFVSNKVPAMPPDLKGWALWISGIAAAVALIWTKVRLKDSKDPIVRKQAQRYLTFSGIGAVVFAVLYFVIARIWTSETGGWTDVLFQIASVTSYSLCFACVTAMAAAGEKLAG
jgi:hypothetical protein